MLSYIHPVNFLQTGSRFHKSIIYFNQELADEPVVYDSQHFLSPTDSKSLHNRGKSPARNNGFSFFQRFAEISGLQPYLNEGTLYETKEHDIMTEYFIVV